MGPRLKRKKPLATLLVERGISPNIEEASRLVMSGNVLVNDQRFDKPGMSVDTNSILRIRGQQPYVSRGGYKLEAALKAFEISVAGRIALDCGASTGGFTDCLLQNGATWVYAVDVGYGQLSGRLRADARVKTLERLNLSDLDLGMLIPAPDLITLDLSYLSLTRAIPIAVDLLASPGQMIALIKPLFEVTSPAARRSGQIDDPLLIVDALQRVIDSSESCGLVVQGMKKLALLPKHGVNEYVVALGKGLDIHAWKHDTQTLLALVEGPGIGHSVID